MTESERPNFDRALDLLTQEFRVSLLPPAIKDQYWQILKTLSGQQFMGICSKLGTSFIKKWSDDFPLPAQFLEAIPHEPRHEQIPRKGALSGNKQVNYIIPKLLELMPKAGQVNSDEQADTMVKKMNAIVNQAFKDLPPTPFLCPQCEDTGYVWVWVQLEPGLAYEGNEVIPNRIPGNPFWITQVGELDPPMPDIMPRLTPCIALCTCLAGSKKVESFPLASSFH